MYLDIYIDGKRQNEYLKLYLIPEKSREDKLKNKETQSLTNAVKSKRIVEKQNGRFGFDGNKEKGKFLFIDWLEEQREYFYDKDSAQCSYTIRNLICHTI